MMHIHFTIPYHLPQEDEALEWAGRVNGKAFSLPLLPNATRTEWQLQLELEHETAVELSYSYQVKRGDTFLRSEPPQNPHIIRLRLDEESIEEGSFAIHDKWILAHPEHKYSSSPLAKLMRRSDLSKTRMPAFCASSGDAFLLPSHSHYEGKLFAVGEHPSIGHWDPCRGMSLTPCRSGYLLQFPERVATEYKLVLQRPDGAILWEEDENRYYRPHSDGIFTFDTIDPPRFPQYHEIEAPQLLGTAVPLFSLRSSTTQGIGDFSAATELLNWMQRQGHNILQLLPIYDTTFTRTDRDSYPYSAITTYAFHPIYLDVRQLPGYSKAKEYPRWEQEAKRLESYPKVHYSEVLAYKDAVADTLFEHWLKEGGDKAEEYISFCHKEQSQLLPYALFCVIRDLYPKRSVEEFPSYSDVLEEWSATQTFRGKSIAKSITRHFYTQYHLFSQLDNFVSAAHSKGIIIKGDLPIGVSRNSVDVWINPNLFHLEYKAGAPPDAFSSKGQDWNFPTYNWKLMRADGYQWWQRRLQQMARHFDVLRIDHVLGFFRIWSIPIASTDPGDGYYVPAKGFLPEEVRGIEAFCTTDPQGLKHPALEPHHIVGFDSLSPELKSKITRLRNEYYYHRNEELWKSEAIERLSAILRASDLLLCTEDLGVLPSCISEVLDMLELFSLEVIRMPKLLNRAIVHPEDIRELSVLTTSTHDMPSLRGWWSTLSEKQKGDICSVYGCTNDPTTAGFVRALMAHRYAPLLILPLQDWLVLTDITQDVDPTDEQINKPEDASHVWNYRLPRFF